MKRSVEAGDNNLNLLPIILLLVASAAAIIAMFVFPFFGVYFFFFLLPLTFSLPWSIRRLRRQKKKNTIEGRGFSLAAQVSLQNHKSRFLSQ
jgi:ABC-type transport system involved in cytochrome bd biosynthesis fused ATPase/permease subunit